MGRDSSGVARRIVEAAMTQKTTISSRASCNRRWLWLLLPLALFTLPLTALAQSAETLRPALLILTDRQEKYPLGLHLELLEDPTGQLTIEDVSSPTYNDQFTPSRAQVPNFGSTSAAIWVRFQVRNRTSPITNWRLAVEEARLAYVDLYVPESGGLGWMNQKAGRSRPFSVRDVPYRYGVFKLPLPTGQVSTGYLRVQGASPILLPLTLWSLDAFSQQAQTELLLFGLFYGVLLVMLGYNLFLFASLRNRSYLYLALFITSFGFNDAFREGLAQQYLWSEQPNLHGIGITATSTFITALLFGISFLQTKERTPSLYKAMAATILIAPIYYVLALLGWVSEVGLTILAILIVVLLVTAGYLTWRRDYRPARYFLLAWLLLLGAAAFHNLTNAGLLPGTPFGQQSMRIGMALMVLLLSLALADRINLLKTETEQANLALRESKRRLNQFLEAMPVGVSVYDASGALTYINHHARELLNLAGDPSAPNGPAPTLGQAIDRVLPAVVSTNQPYPPEQMPVARALRGETVAVDDIEIKVNGSNRRKQLEVWASPIFDEQQRLRYAIAAFRDISHRKQMELELRYHRDQLEEVVAERTRELMGFLDLTMLVSEARTLRAVLETALNRIMELGKCQAMALHLPAEDKAGLSLVVQRGLSTVQQRQLQEILLAPPLSEWLGHRQEPVLALDLSNAANVPFSLRLDGFSIYLGVQLRARDRIHGMLSYYRKESRPYSLDEISLLVALAEQLGIIIENHRLRDHIKDAAVVTERQRLARDLHDSINQSLYSINLFTHAARESAEDNDPEQLADRLTRIEDIAQTALKEMRLLLYQLQPDVLTKKGLAEALQQRFDSVERRLGIQVEYQAAGYVDLPSNIAEGLYWAAMEVLNNSLKHAGANRLTVRLTMMESLVELEIADNGCGFEPERVERGMGLQNIRQRVEQLNGCFGLTSAVGAGTTIELGISVAYESAKPSNGEVRL